MGYDQTTYNRLGALEQDLVARQSAFDVASKVKQALEARVATFQAQLEEAQGDLATAQSNHSAARNAEKSILGSMTAALASIRQELVIYGHLQRVLVLTEAAAQQTLVAAYQTSELAATVRAAEAKNSYITPQLQSAADRSEGSAGQAMSDAATALRDVLEAFTAAESAATHAFLVLASLVSLHRLVSGFYPLPIGQTDEVQIPGALKMLPEPDLSTVKLPEKASNDRPLDKIIDKVILDWLVNLDPLFGSAAQGQTSPEDVLVSYFAATSTADDPAPRDDVDFHPGLRRLLQEVDSKALDREDLLQDATTEAGIELSQATQDLARKEASLQAVTRALAAAHQALGA